MTGSQPRALDVAPHLDAMAALLAEPRALATRADARDEDGTSVPYDAPQAVCWCIYGALHRVVPREHWQEVGDALRRALVAKHPGVALAQFGDQARHASVLTLLAEAKTA